MTRQQYEDRIKELEKAPNYGNIMFRIRNCSLIICSVLLAIIIVFADDGMNIKGRDIVFGVFFL